MLVALTRDLRPQCYAAADMPQDQHDLRFLYRPADRRVLPPDRGSISDTALISTDTRLRRCSRTESRSIRPTSWRTRGSEKTLPLPRPRTQCRHFASTCRRKARWDLIGADVATPTSAAKPQ